MKKDPIQTHRQAIDMLLESGVSFTVPRRGMISRFLKHKTFIINPPTLAALYRISKEVNSIEFDPLMLIDDAKLAPFDLVLTNTRFVSRVVAVAVEPYANEKRIAVLSKYFYDHLYPAKLLEIVMIILRLSSIADFTSSIALIKTIRAAQPKSSAAIE